MNETRDQILGAIRRSLKRGPLSGAEAAEAEARLAGHPRSTVPARARRDHAGQVSLFADMAEAVNATVQRVAALGDVPQAVSDYLKGENLPARVRLAPDPALDACAWDQIATLEVSRGASDGRDEVGVTGAFAGIAETGTLMMLSGPEHPSTLNFLPETHIVVLQESQVAGGYEDAWDKVRVRVSGQGGDADGSLLPRAVTMVTGPSRTADIEQTLYLGAHGPRRLHIILVHGAKTDA